VRVLRDSAKEGGRVKKRKAVLKSLKAYNTKEDAIGVLGSNSRGSVRNFSLRCRKAKSPISIVSGKNTLLRDAIIIAMIEEDSSTT
jgi:hypothetical protein